MNYKFSDFLKEKRYRVPIPLWVVYIAGCTIAFLKYGFEEAIGFLVLCTVFSYAMYSLFMYKKNKKKGKQQK